MQAKVQPGSYVQWNQSDDDQLRREKLVKSQELVTAGWSMLVSGLESLEKSTRKAKSKWNLRKTPGVSPMTV
eukprot:s4920_g3.t1